MKYPVTNAQFHQFVQATGCRTPLFWTDGAFPEEKADHPVVGVSYLDALAFCAWARQVTGLPIRLPTEPEWEKASRGPETRLFAWGDEWQKGMCNTKEENSEQHGSGRTVFTSGRQSLRHRRYERQRTGMVLVLIWSVSIRPGGWTRSTRQRPGRGRPASKITRDRMHLIARIGRSLNGKIGPARRLVA